MHKKTKEKKKEEKLRREKCWKGEGEDFKICKTLFCLLLGSLCNPRFPACIECLMVPASIAGCIFKMAAEMASNLEEEALKRKEKLRAMRQKSGLAGEQQPEQTRGEKRQAEEISEPIKVIKFRNYVPKDETLKEKKLPDAKPLLVEDEVQEHLEKAKSTNIIEEVDLTNLAPRKPDWDLKRDVAKKLEKLERRTQRAIVELIRERLQDSEKEDLAAAVNAASTDQGFESD